jgi:hypothetical protein
MRFEDMKSFLDSLPDTGETVDLTDPNAVGKAFENMSRVMTAETDEKRQSALDNIRQHVEGG